MPSSITTKVIGAVLIVTLFFVSAYAVVRFQKKAPAPEVAPIVIEKAKSFQKKTLGTSVQGRAIDAYTYGQGRTHLLFVGGIHGGYEGNSVALAYQFIEYLKTHPEFVPANITVSVIPDANPDGVYKALGLEGEITAADVATEKDLSVGRFNANGVDLNRNFDCKWNPKGVWKGKSVSTGSGAFSEPESKILRDFVTANTISAAVFWHSQANAVYASQCEKGILPVTLDIMNAYADASGYKAVETFDAYAVTGASEDWLASIGIPAITVELSTHSAVEWNKNSAGIAALFKYYVQ